ncbi:MAG: amino acid adenylation domain-containing protein, partial [Deltaproteobacteria bacterium]|nr:amino acid adenylation domain-containing protein [Deltaproteobacteria bacterium]
VKNELTFELDERPEGIIGRVEYSTDLFDPATISRMIVHFETLLEGIVANSEQRVSELPLLTEAERRQLLVEWNDTQTQYPSDKCIHQLFEVQAEQTPEAVALVFEDRELTYQDLNAKANQVAHHLQTLGVGPEGLVGICLERSLEMVVGLLGVLKAGAAYVPLDPTYPKERLAFMLEDSKVQVLLTQERLTTVLPEHQAQVIFLDPDLTALAGQSRENPDCQITSDQPAYVVYTSGSTGRPKGVIGLHRGAVNRFSWMWDQFPFEENEICCQKTSLNFVDSLWEIFGPLLQGIKTVIIPDEIVKDVPRLVETLASQDVTRIVLVPSLLRTILNMDSDLSNQLRKLKIWVSSGEALPSELTRRFQEILPQSRLLNLYGSSEVSADVTWFDTSSMSSQSESVPIGRPLANTQIYLLDRYLNPVPRGVPGAIYVGGDGLARGYFNRPDLTEEMFIPDPFSDEPGARLYKTGDLGRYLADGNIEFLGRTDHQVKIRGFRIELGEIKATLADHPAVKEAVVVSREDQSGDKSLAAYVVLDQERPSPGQLRDFLKEKLPEYMVPSAFVTLEEMPLTPNGKIDYQSLPAPDLSSLSTQPSRAPQGELEIQLAKLWEQVLGVQPIGADDNFFGLGGHSLLAVTLLARMEKIFGRELPLLTLFQAPTVAQMAGILRQEGYTVPWRALSAVQPQGARRPLFYVGTNDLVHATAPLLGPDQPVYGLNVLSLQPQDGTIPLLDLTKIAQDFIQEIQTVQPEGPYSLFGYCLGGGLVLEMAQQLLDQGQEV